jgi:Cu(I)/Ag(I) efflux system membrane fusion protein
MSDIQPVPRRVWPWVLPAVLGALIAGVVIGHALKREHGAKPAPAAAEAKKVMKYYCTMHPTVMSDKPGTCYICNMPLELIKESKDEHAGHEPGLPGLAAITVAPEIRQRLGLTTGAVEKRRLDREVRTSARIVADETRLFKVNTKVEGWVEKLFVNVTGQEVKKGDPLLAIYSPELVSAQQEYLAALRLKDRSAAAGGDLAAAARERLALWDISAGQIERLEKTRQAERTMTLYAAADGVVTEKNVLAGQKIMPGDPLLVIADLSRVWADADLYQSDLPHVRVGLPVEITLPDWPGKSFTGAVTFLTPTLDPETRTVKARLVVENAGLLLKPGMYATARLTSPLGEVLAIPEAAVMRTGERVYAFRDGDAGRLVPVEIKIGPRAGGYFQLLGGLAEGDRVVTSANFLVDSESSRRAAMAGMSGEGGAAAPAAGPAAPSAPAAPAHGGHQH